MLATHASENKRWLLLREACLRHDLARAFRGARPGARDHGLVAELGVWVRLALLCSRVTAGRGRARGGTSSR